jgi:hypothetical protein
MHPQVCIQYEGGLPVAWTYSGIFPERQNCVGCTYRDGG